MAKNITAQRDFSAGELDATCKRGDDMPEFKAGLRQASNFRILNSKKLSNRPGRRALLAASDRVEEVLMAPGVTYYVAFPSGFLKIFNSAGTQVFSEARTWSATTAANVVWAVYDKSIYITFAGMVPRVLTWDGATTWTAADFAVDTTTGGRKQTPFYRIAPKGITLTPSGTTGAINITFSAAYLVAGMIGTRLLYNSRQLTITGVTNPTTGTATVNETLNGGQNLPVAATTAFSVGDVVEGSVSGATGVVLVIHAGVSLDVLLTSAVNFQYGTGGLGVTPDTVIGPLGSSVINAAVSAISPPASQIWDEEVMNSYRGWPQSVFVDQNRLGFCNFPSVPGGIVWSQIANFGNFYPGANPEDPIFELAPNKSQVLYVIPGMDASEFVFCDNKLYYIQITPANPLKPGSVVFNTISEDECAQVQPRRAGEFMLYVTGGGNQIMALKIYGAYTRAYKTESVTELSAHLFTSVRAIAIMTGSGTFAERYIFVLNAAGSVVAGKYAADKNNELSGNVGWTPWTGNGTVKWVSCKGANVLFTTSYAPNGIGAVQIAELLDDTRYLDGSQLYNTQPSGLPIPGGKGPLWWIAGGTVDLIDQTTRTMGTYTVDADGFLIPQNNGGEDFTSATLVAGQAWTGTIEPFVPAAPPGQSAQQRMRKRRVSRVVVTVKDSSGFVFARLKSGKTIPGGPALGTILASTRIPTWNQGDLVTAPPPLREESYSFRPVGRDNDPRNCVIKDTPGPLIIEEYGMESSI